MLITPEMVQMAHERIAEKEQDTRVKISSLRKAQMKERGLTFPVPANPLIVVMVDDFMHTVHIPVCDDPTCVCYALERESIAQEQATKKQSNKSRRKSAASKYQEASLNGNRPFQILR